MVKLEDFLPPEKTIVVDDDQSSPSLTTPPLLSSYNDMIRIMRPLFETVHTLRCMNVIEQGDEGITLQPIVVIGDQSCGKSSLIESLTGIRLPRGNGICTRVPLIMKFQYHSDPVSELRLEYKEECVPVKEHDVSACISRLMKSLAGSGEEISNVPLTLFVKTNSVPDVTIVDLPGVPVDGHLEKISDILETYINHEDCVILHVISAETTDFPTCESIKIIKKFGKNGDRTLHVCTKADEASEDMVAVVTTNYMGPDYVCVRNRLEDETHEEARAYEASLFETHNLLSKIDKSMVGVHAVAQKLLLIQVQSVSNRLRGLVGAINKDLSTCAVNLRQQQQNFTTVSEAMPAFVKIINKSQKSLGNTVQVSRFNEFPGDTQMQCYIKLEEMYKEFSQQLRNNQVKEGEEFLAEEIRVLKEGIWSPEQAFQFLFYRKIDDFSAITCAFLSRLWDYIEFVIIKVVEMHAQNSYPQLFMSLKLAAKEVIARPKGRFKDRIFNLLDMKKLEGYMHDPEVISSWNEMKKKERVILETDVGVDMFFGVRVNVKNLRKYPRTILNEAFDIKTRMVACLEMVHKRFFDSAELNFVVNIFTTVTREIKKSLVDELKSDDENKYKPMLKESPSVTTRRWKLTNRIELLEKLKKVVEITMEDNFFLN